MLQLSDMKVDVMYQSVSVSIDTLSHHYLYEQCMNRLQGK